MYRMLPLFLLTGALLSSTCRSEDDSHQYYEVRSYVLSQSDRGDAIEQYLREALLPALKRQDIGPVGVFRNSEADASDSQRIVVVIPYEDANAIAQTRQELESDSQYQSDASDYLDRGAQQPPYSRIESELLVAMDCMPRLEVADGSLANADRVYELRVYESANERAGNLKVEMFNAGEVPIFLGSGIQPIFIGQAIVGPFTPNLTYLTSYPSENERLEAWKAFRAHPDWLVLKEVAKYKRTVSKIHKYVLVPTSYSQM